MLAASSRAGMMTDSFGFSAPVRATAASSIDEMHNARAWQSKSPQPMALSAARAEDPVSAPAPATAARAGDPVGEAVGVDEAGMAGFIASSFVL
jgi:hypothetical protein